MAGLRISFNYRSYHSSLLWRVLKPLSRPYLFLTCEPEFYCSVNSIMKVEVSVQMDFMLIFDKDLAMNLNEIAPLRI